MLKSIKYTVMRTMATLCAIVIYSGLFDVYIYQLTHASWDDHYKKLFYNYLTIGMIIFYLLDKRKGYVGYFHEQFNSACIWLVVANFGIMIMARHGFDNAELLFICFNATVCLTTSFFVVAGLRNKTFRYY